jgi:hypothetical protein
MESRAQNRATRFFGLYTIYSYGSMEPHELLPTRIETETRIPPPGSTNEGTNQHDTVHPPT